MITGHMTLTTARDAATWAAQLGLNSEGEEKNVAAWIWKNKPFPNCTYAEHPIRDMDADKFWDIASGK